MIEQINALISDIAARFADRRTQVFDVKIANLVDQHLSLAGRVLDEATLQTLVDQVQTRLPQLALDVSAVQIYRTAAPCMVHVATNLTSLHASPSWLAEMLTQNTFGARLEVLENKDNWAFVRQTDGYLGWMYRPYLTEQPTPAPTYIVSVPFTYIYAEPNCQSPIHSRLVGGTLVQIVSTRGAWAEVDANTWGWVPLEDLLALSSLPKTVEAQRKEIAASALRMVGVPYLWGGTSVNGIDCSGLAQLAHHWAGITIPRDADQQYNAARKIEPPFQTGDLLFFGEQGEDRAITHVAISLGEWHIIHSSRSRNGVYLDEVQEVPHLRDSFIGAASFLSQ